MKVILSSEMQSITNQHLLSMEVDKAPGPDGFTITFFRSCWSIVKANLMNFHEA
jgi:hypothetical protein